MVDECPGERKVDEVGRLSRHQLHDADAMGLPDDLPERGRPLYLGRRADRRGDRLLLAKKR